MGDAVRDAYADARFTAEISTRMQVPDRILLAADSPARRSLGANASADSGNNGSPAAPGGEGHFNDLGMRQRDPRLDMQVPDRILVAGDNTHVASKSTPRELQMEAAVLPPTVDHVRVSTPPRSIRLDEHSFPSATDDEASAASTSTLDIELAGHPVGYGTRRSSRGTTGDLASEPHQDKAGSLALTSEGTGIQGRENLAPHEEVQLIRRQLAKLNHRLMAVELENQQQQQREMVLTLLVSAYFLGKLVMWVNRSL